MITILGTDNTIQREITAAFGHVYIGSFLIDNKENGAHAENFLMRSTCLVVLLHPNMLTWQSFIEMMKQAEKRNLRTYFISQATDLQYFQLGEPQRNDVTMNFRLLMTKYLSNNGVHPFFITPLTWVCNFKSFDPHEGKVIHLHVN